MNPLRYAMSAVALAVTCASVTATAQQNQAEFHYKVALAALGDNNLKIALEELKQAAALDSRNPLVHYNIAVVLQKLGDPSEAMSSLKQAIALGVPHPSKAAADELLINLTYEVRRNATAIVGSWSTELDFATLWYTEYKFREDGTFSCRTDLLDKPQVGARRERELWWSNDGTYNVQGRTVTLRLGQVRSSSGNDWKGVWEFCAFLPHQRPGAVKDVQQEIDKDGKLVLKGLGNVEKATFKRD